MSPRTQGEPGCEKRRHRTGREGVHFQFTTLLGKNSDKNQQGETTCGGGSGVVVKSSLRKTKKGEAEFSACDQHPESVYGLSKEESTRAKKTDAISPRLPDSGVQGKSAASADYLRREQTTYQEKRKNPCPVNILVLRNS